MNKRKRKKQEKKKITVDKLFKFLKFSTEKIDMKVENYCQFKIEEERSKQDPFQQTVTWKKFGGSD